MVKSGITKKYIGGNIVEDKTSKKSVFSAASNNVIELIYIDTDCKNEAESLFLNISNFKHLKRLQI
jgi:hypothetical protein